MLAKMKGCLRSKNVEEPQKNEIIISIVGLDDAGKSTVVRVIKGDNDIKELSPTVGYEPHELIYNAKPLALYDLGGGARVRDIWKHYLSESYGFIFVIDCSNSTRIYECSKVFSSFIENDKVYGKPLLILGNKQDKPSALDESEIVQYLNVEDLVNRYQTPCRIETCVASSGTGKHLDESLRAGFDWLFRCILSKYDELKTRVEYDVQIQKSRELKIKKEKSEKVRQKREAEYPAYDQDDSEKISENPWKPLNDLKQKDSKKLSATDSSKLSAYDRQLLEEMRVTSPRPRLTTIDEEKSKLRSKFGRSNKLSPYDEAGSDLDLKSRGDRSWAIKETNYTGTKATSSSMERGRSLRPTRFED